MGNFPEPYLLRYKFQHLPKFYNSLIYNKKSPYFSIPNNVNIAAINPNPLPILMVCFLVKFHIITNC